jgi:cytochrome c-type biogenesis protein CcmF
VLTTQYTVERDIRMMPGETYTIAPYEYRFDSLAKVRGPNYVADEARFSVSRDGIVIARLQPQKRRYLASGQTMTEASIDPGFTRDIYIAMGEPLGGEAWAIRLHYKPFVRWIWAGAIFMSFGGFLTLADRRYRRQRQRSEVPMAAGVAGSGAL